MKDILIPSEVSIKQILNNKKNLSPSNYKKVDIRNKNRIKIKELLLTPYFFRGFEPGSQAYLDELETDIRFIRNSCLDKLNYTVQIKKSIYIKPKSEPNNTDLLLKYEDLVVATDANIGDCALFIEENNINKKSYLSSGLVKLNLKEEVNKYYVFAMLKNSYFYQQLDSITPKGSTIRHSGDRLLECEIPLPLPNQYWVYDIIENLIKNIIHAESRAKIIQGKIFSFYEDKFNDINISTREPKMSDLFSYKRIDAGFYSQEVQGFFEKVRAFDGGSKSLEDMGYKTRRGPNLAKRDIGRSIITDIFKKGYSKLIYPSYISDAGYIEKTSFIGTTGKLWFLQKNDILFSGEGNVGKTFAICDDSMKFVTNFHGIIITPIKYEEIDIATTIYISTFLNYMKYKGIMDKLSVGGQGGSFAVQYWDILKFPNFKKEELIYLKELYYSEYNINPFYFNKAEIEKLGIYEINNLRTLCTSLLNRVIEDIKNDNLKDKDYYLDLTEF